MHNEDVYFIPVNFTDAGRVLGLFELRNCMEAAVLALPTFGLCSLIAHYTPFSVTIKLILSLCLLVPVCGFGLIGIRDESLSRFICTYVRWRRCRRIAINKGGSIKRGHQKNHLWGSSGRDRGHRARK